MSMRCVGSRMGNVGRTLELPSRLSCGNQPAHIRLINRRHAVRSATHTLQDDLGDYY